MRSELNDGPIFNIYGEMVLVAIINRCWNFFCSLKLTAAVISLLFFGCLLGMFFDQTLNFYQQFEPYENRPFIRTILVFFEIGDVFHSWWFTIIVLMLALNLIACSIQRLPQIWIDIRNPPLHLDDTLLQELPNKRLFHYQISEHAQQCLARIVPSKAHRVISGQTTSYFWERQKWGRLGVYIIHTALLMVMFGSMATTNLGVDGFMTIPEGRAEQYVQIKGPGSLLANANLGFEVVCRDFRLKTFVDGSPMAFESDLEIWDPKVDKNPVLAKTIRVNDPLDYRGYTFYQASYQPWKGEEKILLAIGEHGTEKLLYTVGLGEKIVMKNGSYFIPTEAYDNYGGLGEAIKVTSKSPTGEESSFVVFRQYPEFDRRVRRGEFDLSYQGVEQAYATGLSVGKVPGIYVVFSGFVLLFVGLFMAFQMRHRRYYVRFRPLADGAEIDLCAIAFRHEQRFQDEFNALAQQFEEDKNDQHLVV